jgi:hypothetical protein
MTASVSCLQCCMWIRIRSEMGLFGQIKSGSDLYDKKIYGKLYNLALHSINFANFLQNVQFVFYT